MLSCSLFVRWQPAFETTVCDFVALVLIAFALPVVRQMSRFADFIECWLI